MSMWTVELAHIDQLPCVQESPWGHHITHRVPRRPKAPAAQWRAADLDAGRVDAPGRHHRPQGAGETVPLPPGTPSARFAALAAYGYHTGATQARTMCCQEIRLTTAQGRGSQAGHGQSPAPPARGVLMGAHHICRG